MAEQKIEFTKEDRFIIAEFIYSKQADILILTDCTKLIEVLAKHKLIEGKEEWIDHINNKSNGIVAAIEKILAEKISNEQGNEIMDEYYKGA